MASAHALITKKKDWKVDVIREENSLFEYFFFFFNSRSCLILSDIYFMFGLGLTLYFL